MIISVLKTSKDKPVLHKLVKNDANLPSRIVDKMLRKLQTGGLLYIHGGILEVSTLQRLRLAVLAVEQGADYERVCCFLGWREFERIGAISLEASGYNVETSLRFKQGGRRWEIDVVGCRKPLILCLDCKHWRRGVSSKLRRAAEEQVRRTLAFSEFLPNPAVRIDCASWNNARFVPVVLTLMQADFKFFNGTPVVPVLRLQDFLVQLPTCADSLKHFDKSWSGFKLAP